MKGFPGLSVAVVVGTIFVSSSCGRRWEVASERALPKDAASGALSRCLCERRGLWLFVCGVGSGGEAFVGVAFVDAVAVSVASRLSLGGCVGLSWMMMVGCWLSWNGLPAMEQCILL